MAGFYAALRRQNDAAPLADFATALHTEPICMEGNDLRVTSSIGIANYPNDGVDADTLRIPTKPATHSNRKPATDSDLKPAGVPI
jgi:GGDEF domain-containing protein